MDASSTVLLLAVGGGLGYYCYTMAKEKNQTSTQQHRVVNMGNVQPPPNIRVPIGGFDPNTGYFDSRWFYGNKNPYTHEDNL